jgi:hypothetical protein
VRRGNKALETISPLIASHPFAKVKRPLGKTRGGQHGGGWRGIASMDRLVCVSSFRRSLWLTFTFAPQEYYEIYAVCCWSYDRDFDGDDGLSR